MSTHSHRPSRAPASGSMCSPVASTPSSRPSSSWSPAIASCTSTPVRALRFRDRCSRSSSRRSVKRHAAQLERCGTDYDLLHANYWVSGAVGHRLKHELDLPLVTTFHSLDRVRAASAGLDDEVTLRPRVEAEVVRCADLVVAATDEERDQLVRYYGADPETGRHRPARCRRRTLLAGRPGRGAPRAAARRPSRAPVRRAHPAAQGRRPRDRSARPARHTARQAPRGGWAERPAG